MPDRSETTGRVNQRHRTRKDLLAAAARLLKQGRTPTMDDVAEAAMVSRATAYRYFPTIESLLLEAPIEGAVPAPEEILAGDASTDPAERADRAEAALHEVVYRNETQLRLMLAASLERVVEAAKSGGGGEEGTHTQNRGPDAPPIRQNRRTPLIEAALAPARERFNDDTYEKLCASLALVFGIESMVVLSDVLGLDEQAAREVKSWAVRVLVRAALDDSARGR